MGYLLNDEKMNFVFILKVLIFIGNNIRLKLEITEECI